MLTINICVLTQGIATQGIAAQGIAPTHTPTPAEKHKTIPRFHSSNILKQFPSYRTNTSVQAPEFIWKVPDEKTEIFSGLVGDYSGSYGTPVGFCWDDLCDKKQNPKIVDDNHNPGYSKFLRKKRSDSKY
jgi:hypothetical protein